MNNEDKTIYPGVVYEVFSVEERGVTLNHPWLIGIVWDESSFDLFYRPPVPTLKDVINKWVEEYDLLPLVASREFEDLARKIRESGCEL
jgi:hypothetical protein